MRFFKVSPEVQTRLAVAVPLVALALSLFVVYPSYGRYSELKKKVEQQKTELNELKSVSLPTPGPVAPAAEDLPSEPPQFLALIRAIAAESGCTVTGFDLTSPPADQAKEGAPVRAVRARVELDGSYAQARAFVDGLSRARRMLAVSDFQITGVTRDNLPGIRPLHVSVEMERYVTPRAKVAAGPGR